MSQVDYVLEQEERCLLLGNSMVDVVVDVEDFIEVLVSVNS